MSSVFITVNQREQAILSHMPQVKLLALRMHRRCPPEVLLEDLVSAGTVGLIEAVNRYEPERNVKLKTLAEHRIRGAIRDYLRQLDPMPRLVRRFQRDRDDAKQRLEGHLERLPCESELAAETGLHISRYRKLAVIVQSASVYHLDSPVNSRLQIPQIAAVGLQESETDDLLDRLRVAIAKLPSRERAVVLALLRELRLHEIGEELQLSASRISQLKRRAIARLRIAFRLAARGSVPRRHCPDQ